MPRASHWDDAHGRSLLRPLHIQEKGRPLKAGGLSLGPSRQAGPLGQASSSRDYSPPRGIRGCSARTRGRLQRPAGRGGRRGREAGWAAGSLWTELLSVDHEGQGTELGCSEWGFWKAGALETPSRAQAGGQAGEKAQERTSWFMRAQA